MKNYLLYIAVLFFCSAQSHGLKNKLPENKARSGNFHRVTLLNDIQGDWKCTDDKCEKMCETCCGNLVYLDFRINGDSISIFNYPSQYFGTYKIFSYPDSVSMNERLLSLNSLLNRAFVNPLPHSETHYIYSAAEFLYLNDSAWQLKEKNILRGNYFIYQRDSFDNSVVERLRKDSIDPGLLIGKWKLRTKYEQYYLGDEQEDGFYHVSFPFRLPLQLSFTAKSLLPPHRNGKQIYISVNGKNKDFYIARLTEYKFIATPGKWYKGEEEVAVEYLKQ